MRQIKLKIASFKNLKPLLPFLSKETMSNKFDHAKAVEELQQYRMTNERSSENVSILGARLIKDKYTSKLGDQGNFFLITL